MSRDYETYTLVHARSPNVLNLGDRVRCPSGGFARITELNQGVNGLYVELHDGVSSWPVHSRGIVRAAT